MVNGFEIPKSVLERITPRDKEVILLAPLYFWAKSLRRNQYGGGDPDIVTVVSDVLVNHPKRAELFTHLSDPEIRQICRSMDKIIEWQELVVDAEGGSIHDEGPNEFILQAADEALYIRGRLYSLGWFTAIDRYTTRQSIMKAVIHEKIPGNISGLLSDGTV